MAKQSWRSNLDVLCIISQHNVAHKQKVNRNNGKVFIGGKAFLPASLSFLSLLLVDVSALSPNIQPLKKRSHVSARCVDLQQTGLHTIPTTTYVVLNFAAGTSNNSRSTLLH